jgi:hypothetical protein
MIKFTHASADETNKEYEIWFRYDYNEFTKTKTTANGLITTTTITRYRTTEALIRYRSWTDGVMGIITAASGFASCDPYDNFTKEKGRQIALRQAVKDASYRGAALNAYFNRHKASGTKNASSVKVNFLTSTSGE